MKIPQLPIRIRTSGITWIAVLATIPVLSIFGRPLQRLLREHITSAQLAAGFLLCSLALLFILARKTTISSIRDRFLHLSWSAILYLVVPWFLPTVEERLHFIVFGVLGFLSETNFGLKRSLVICLFVGGLDEILQWVLPDRVGDLRDVGFNWLASIGGCFLSYYLIKRNEIPDPVN